MKGNEMTFKEKVWNWTSWECAEKYLAEALGVMHTDKRSDKLASILQGMVETDVLEFEERDGVEMYRWRDTGF